MKGIQEIAGADYPTEPVYKNDEERWEARRAQKMPEKFHDAYQDFAFETASALLKDETENVVYSPLSLYFALSAAAEGANGETRKEILNVLGYPYVENLSADCKGAFEYLYHVTNEGNNKPNEWGEYPAESRYTLQIANSLWADESLDVKKEFAGHVAQYFYGDVFKADLGAEETWNAMAEWVKEKTNGVLAPEPAPLGEEIRLSLRNTIYFYDEWTDRFDESATAKDTFTLADGTTVSCDFMNRTMGSHGFQKGENYTLSSLNLKNGQMIVVLPDEGIDVHELLKDPEGLREILEGSEGQMMGEVVWKVPKFSYGSGVDLADMLKELGITRAFSGTEADFSNIADLSGNPEISALYLSSVTQDAHIGLDENGVEAAAFTELALAGAAMPAGRAEMILDRPFLYVIKNRGEILFLGICENPAE